MKKILLAGLTLASSFLMAQTSNQCNTTDSLALVDFYNSTGGSSWTNNTNWLSGNVNSWYGVSVKANGRVNELKLTNNNVSGTIPTSIGNLAGIKRIWLDQNNLSGSIPTEITNLDTLVEIILSHNNFSGSIPSTFGTMDALRNLYLNNNALTGNLPANIFNNNSLQIVAVNDNQLTGFPAVFNTANGITTLYAGNNNFTGPLSSNIGNLSLLEELWLDNNSLNGNLPATLTGLASLRYLGVSNNNFTGTIPDMSGSISTFEWGFYENNMFSGLAGTTNNGVVSYISVNDNNLYFNDLTPNMQTYLTYAPQDTVGNDTVVNGADGGSITLNTGISAPDAGNAYQWYKDGAAIAGATNESYTINPISAADEGDYHCEITNGSAPALTLYTRIITLVMDQSCDIYTLSNTIIGNDGDVITITLAAGSNVPTGIIGMDLCLNYDPTVVQPTVTSASTSTVIGSGGGAYASVNNTIGEVNIATYYTVSAPGTAEFSGSGDIVSINFVAQAGSAGQNTGITICGITEGYQDGIIPHCYTPNTPAGPFIITGNIPTTVTAGVYFHGRTHKKLKYDIASPSTYIPTYIETAQADCSTNGDTTFTNLNGVFSISNGHPKLSFKRDIPGDVNNPTCTSISSLITSGDELLIKRIATKNTGFNPTINHIIASDVNMDGVIRSNDITLVNRRRNGDICEFPQAWNYGGGSPTEASFDWVFYDNNFLSDAAYQIDPSYPTPSGSGYSRDGFPYTDNCVTIPNRIGTYNTRYNAVLLGDVSGSWNNKASHGTQFRMAQSGSTKDDGALSGINIYPNPTSNHEFFINTTDKNIQSVELFNVSGKRIEYVENSEMANTIKVEVQDKSLNGLMMIKLNTDKGAFFDKINILK